MTVYLRWNTEARSFGPNCNVSHTAPLRLNAVQRWLAALASCPHTTSDFWSCPAPPRNESTPNCTSAAAIILWVAKCCPHKRKHTTWAAVSGRPLTKMAGDSGHEPLDLFVHGRLSLNPDLDVNSLQTAFAFNVCVCFACFDDLSGRGKLLRAFPGDLHWGIRKAWSVLGRFLVVNPPDVAFRRSFQPLCMCSQPE